MDTKKESFLGSFGLHVKKLRAIKKLSQGDVVMNSNSIIKGTVSDIEIGKRNFSFSTLIDLAKGLDIYPKELLDFEV